MSNCPWDEAARAVADVVQQFSELGIPAATAEIWAGPFEAELANRYDGSQNLPPELPELQRRCEARSIAPASAGSTDEVN